MTDQELQTTCCVVGGGPAGVMLGYLLARAGVDVTVLEKHQDFNRDFRGDTVHPSTLEVMHELGLLSDFLTIPHQELTSVGGVFGDFAFRAADMTRLPTHCKFVALMPQWDFLNFLSDKGKQFSTFRLRTQHECVDLLHDNDRVSGVKAQTPDGPVQIRADLVVGCDGRHSTSAPGRASLTSSSMACRLTCSGSASAGRRAILSSCWAISTMAECSSSSTVAITFRLGSSFAKARLRRYKVTISIDFARIFGVSRPISAIALKS